ncbi:MAG: glutamine-hydrolyzing carbamoyl-phosphate synthase small subunit [Methylocystis sp.]
MTIDQARGWRTPSHTGALVLGSGEIIQGYGLGAVGESVGEVCFNTAMTGYQEILTDPSYAGQIVTFTFPHIGNVGTNNEDIETVDLEQSAGAVGAIFGAPVTEPSNFRSQVKFTEWLVKHGIIALSGIDTRALTTLIREKGMQNAIIAHSPQGKFDFTALRDKAKNWSGIDGADLVPTVGTKKNYHWNETLWRLGKGYGSQQEKSKYRVVAIDYGIKRNILRLLAEHGCEVIVVPATTLSSEILALAPDGVFLSNGPGDPAETGKYAAPVIRDLLAAKIPTFGICLGHQIMALAVGAKTKKMPQGHHGANHPVKDFITGKVEIVSMNHGFAVERDSLPENAVETHRSLFDGSNCGIALTDRPAFSVQYHPEASPGPQDSHYLFARFIDLMQKSKAA